MKPTSRQLALRDPAMAALLGIVGGQDSNFGGEFGTEFGFGFGAEAALAAPLHPAEVQQAVAHYKTAKMRSAYTSQRKAILEPNANSEVKIERYSFSINDTIVLGTVKTLSLSGQPDTSIRPQRVTMNAPAPGFVVVNEIKVANVSVTVGGAEDAFNYGAGAFDSHLDMPTLCPANRATVLAGYTGFVPPGYVGATSYLFAVSFKGPASIVA